MGKPNKDKQALLRQVPKVDQILKWVADSDWGRSDSRSKLPKRIVLQAVRECLADLRADLLSEASSGEACRVENILAQLKMRVQQKQRHNFQTVINGTGVVVHTNLGRSLLPPKTMETLMHAGGRYSNLELDLATGKRGSRYSLVEDLLCELTGAEAGLIVNNNAAAVLLVLDTLAKERQVIVSRGQLVEIGGSFRIPDVMERSGAQLVEVGATNRTHLRDYENAIVEETALLLKVHTSNYKIVGFSSEVPLEDLVGLGKKYNLPVMEDLGSGCLVDLSRYGLLKEPTVGEVVQSGVDVVTFSGDKLLGGPQAGIIVGKKAIVEKIKKNPLNRALRIDKFTLAGLESILRLYFDESEAVATIPTLAMLSAPESDLKRRAQRLLRRIKKNIAGSCKASCVSTVSRVGGGALPEQALPTWALCLVPLDQSTAELEKKLRLGKQAVICRIENDSCVIDMRTVLETEVPMLAEIIGDLFDDSTPDQNDQGCA